MIYLDLDIETRSEGDLKKCGLAKYARLPSTEILCLVHKVQGRDPVVNNVDALKRAAENPEVIFRAHHAAFEREHLKCKLGIDIPISRWRCSAALAASFNLPRALGPVGYCLQLPKQKDEEGKKTMMRMCKPLARRFWDKNEPEYCPLVKGDWTDKRYHLTAESYDTLLAYCIDDVLSEEAIFDKLGELPEFEQRLWERDYIMNYVNGVKIDVELCEAAVHTAERLQDKAKKECEERFGFSPTQVAKLCEFCGLEDGKAETVSRAVAASEEGDIADVLGYRQTVSNSSVKKYTSALNMNEGGYVYGTMMYHGAGQTGRWAGRGLQVQNFPRGSYTEADITMIKDGRCDDMELLKQATRGMFDGGLAVCDYSAIEARVLAWGAQQRDKLEAFRNGRDMYKVAASKMYGKPEEDITKDERQIGKISELACGYGGSKGAFRGMAEVYGLDNLDDEFCQRIVTQWRQANTMIVGMWYNFERDALNAIARGGRHGTFEVIGDFLHMYLPSGRTIKYFKPKVLTEPTFGNPSVTFITEPSLNDKKHSTKTIPGCTLARVYTYGGKLVQGWTQATARDLLADAFMKLPEDAANMLVHDEIVSAKYPLEVLEKAMLDAPEWAEGLPLDVDGFEAERYRK